MIITLADAKAHLNVTTDDDNALITSLVETATAHVAEFVGSDVEMTADDAPAMVKHAVRQMVAFLYDDREATGFDPTPLLGSHRRWVF